MYQWIMRVRVLPSVKNVIHVKSLVKILQSPKYPMNWYTVGTIVYFCPISHPVSAQVHVKECSYHCELFPTWQLCSQIPFLESSLFNLLCISWYSHHYFKKVVLFTVQNFKKFPFISCENKTHSSVDIISLSIPLA